jgi:hypothetical protein
MRSTEIGPTRMAASSVPSASESTAETRKRKIV